MNILIKGVGLSKNGDYTFHFASDENGENTIALIIDNLTGTIVANEGVIEIDDTECETVISKSSAWSM